MPAGKVDLEIDKGATYNKTFYWKDSAGAAIDMTGYTAKMHIKQNISSTTVIAELTTENGGITITPLEGKIELYISDEDTALITQLSGVYDLNLMLSGDLKKFVRGSVSFPASITDQ